ncbi:MAG: pyridoxal-phosphate dependent enzyme [Acidobacteriota bacterium]|nr:MAG: pyridoxal-phosphate dependent enzyme [Acidobacteriota bacterium]
MTERRKQAPAGCAHHMLAKTPLFHRFLPELDPRLAWVALAELPTPVQRVRCVGDAQLWIKRDDKTSSEYGGNKTRKLEFSLGEALQQKRTHVVTLGALGTHHGLATSIFAKKLGLACSIILFDQPPSPHVLQNLLLMHGNGAELIYCRTLLKAVIHYFALQRLRRSSSYFLFGGGSNASGTLGYVNAAFELKQQIDEGQLPAPDQIFCAFGSGGTLAGLALGVQLAGLRSRVVGVRIAPAQWGPIPLATPRHVLSLANKAYQLLVRSGARLPDVPLEPPTVIDDFLGAGYGHPSAAGREAADILRESDGIELDETYTAKTFAAVLAAARERSQPDRVLLYWHTLNSVDLESRARQIDPLSLPRPFDRFFRHP